MNFVQNECSFVLLKRCGVCHLQVNRWERQSYFKYHRLDLWCLVASLLLRFYLDHFLETESLCHKLHNKVRRKDRMDQRKVERVRRVRRPCSLCGSHRTISNYRTKATHSGFKRQLCSFACLMSVLLNTKRTPGCCRGLTLPPPCSTYITKLFLYRSASGHLSFTSSLWRQQSQSFP